MTNQPSTFNVMAALSWAIRTQQSELLYELSATAAHNAERGGHCPSVARELARATNALIEAYQEDGGE